MVVERLQFMNYRPTFSIVDERSHFAITRSAFDFICKLQHSPVNKDSVEPRDVIDR